MSVVKVDGHMEIVKGHEVPGLALRLNNVPRRGGYIVIRTYETFTVV